MATATSPGSESYSACAVDAAYFCGRFQSLLFGPMEGSVGQLTYKKFMPIGKNFFIPYIIHLYNQPPAYLLAPSPSNHISSIQLRVSHSLPQNTLPHIPYPHLSFLLVQVLHNGARCENRSCGRFLYPSRAQSGHY